MPVTWTTVRDYSDIHYEHSGTGIARITIDRQQVRNAFRPQTVTEMLDAFQHVREPATQRSAPAGTRATRSAAGIRTPRGSRA